MQRRVLSVINFDFVSPTKIYFGKDRENEIGNIISSFGFSRVLLVYGMSSIKRSGLYQKVVEKLDESKITHFEVSGVRANPEISLSRLGIEICRMNNIELVLAIGGGSVIDTAKSIACGVFYDGDTFDFNLHKVSPTKALPVGVILTISASGSELSNSCVMMDDKTGIKQGFNHDLNKPLFAVCNPELTYSVDKYQTGCGIVDIISHSLERYFCPSNELEFADSIALAIIKDMVKVGPICINDPTNYDARAVMMLDSSYSHNGLTGLGKSFRFPIHAMEHILSAYDIKIAHGAGLSVLIPGWIKFTYKYDIDKFVHFFKEVFDINVADKEECVKIGIQSLKSFFKSIGMPITLSELNLHESDIPNLVNLMTLDGTRLIGQGTIKTLDKEEITLLLKDLL